MLVAGNFVILRVGNLALHGCYTGGVVLYLLPSLLGF